MIMTREIPSKTKKKLVMLDFDGVIVDSLDLWYSITLETNPDMPFEEYSKMSEVNFYESFQSEKPTVAFNPNLNGREIYHDKLLATFVIHEKIKATITELSGKHSLAIVSSGSETTIRAFLKKEGIEHHFDHVLGFELSKSKTVKFNHLLNHYETVAEETIFVTDTLGDVNEAHAAGVRSIAVTWGLHPTETLEKGNPHAIVDEREELLESITAALEN